MAKDIMETVGKKLKDGWIKAWMGIEVLAVTSEAADSSLRKHVEKMGKEDCCIIYKQEFKESKQVPNPFKKSEHAYSKVVEIELVAKRFEDLMYLVMNYGPSGVEILEPGEIKLGLGEAQGILNSISDLIHKFASRAGGVIIST